VAVLGGVHHWLLAAEAALGDTVTGQEAGVRQVGIEHRPEPADPVVGDEDVPSVPHRRRTDGAVGDLRQPVRRGGAARETPFQARPA
jgi:hypothetical protein